MEVELEYSWAHIDVPDPEHSDQTENKKDRNIITDCRSSKSDRVIVHYDD